MERESLIGRVPPPGAVAVRHGSSLVERWRERGNLIGRVPPHGAVAVRHGISWGEMERDLAGGMSPVT